MYRYAIKINSYFLQKRTVTVFLQHRKISDLHTPCYHSIKKLDKELLSTSTSALSDINGNSIHDRSNNIATIGIDSELLKKYDKILTHYKRSNAKLVDKSITILKSFKLQLDEEYLYSIVVAYGHSSDPKGILNVFIDMKLKGFQNSLFLLNELMFAYSKNNNMMEVEDTLLAMQAMNIKPNITSIHHLLSTILNSPGVLDWDYFIETYTTYCCPKTQNLEAGIVKLVTDDNIYRLLLKGCHKNRNIEQAKEWFNELLAADIHPHMNIIEPFYDTLG
jgi:pentatricopeptide repeat protein